MTTTVLLISLGHGFWETQVEDTQVYQQISIWLQNDWVKNIGILAIVYIVLTFVTRTLKITINRRFTDNSVKLRLRSIVSILFAIVFALVALSLFSNRLSGLTVALGVAGAGIAFALQEVIGSLAGWFAIHFGSFFSIGDRVMLGGTKGDVIDIGLLRTTVMEIGSWVNGDQYTGRVVRIANSFLFKEPVVNYSADFPFLWDEITIPIKYGSDIQKTRNLLQEIANKQFDSYEEGAKKEWKTLVDKFVIENAKIDNQIYITADQNWISFTIRYVTDYKARRVTKNDLFTTILEAIESNEFVGIAGATLEITGDNQFFNILSEKNQSPS